MLCANKSHKKAQVTLYNYQLDQDKHLLPTVPHVPLGTDKL